MLAHEERNIWRASLERGVLPEDIKEYIEAYRQCRNDETWRASRAYEALGEAALYYHDRIHNYE